MRSMYWQLGTLETISAFAFRHRETKKKLCRGVADDKSRTVNRKVSPGRNSSIQVGVTVT